MNQYRNIKKALVVGLGYRTGLSMCNFLAGAGIDTVASDSKDRQALAEVTASLNSRVRLITGEQKPSILDEGFDVLILSPGVPKKIPLVVEAGSRGIPVISEIEFASRYLRGKTIAITGTDGKSTTTALTDHIFKELGFDSRMGGNIGIPLISFAEETTESSITVIELSSFQLETIQKFRPDTAAILNITPDHLDRYDGMEDYAAAKMRITMNQDGSDYLIYNQDDELIRGLINNVKARALGFSLSSRDADVFYESGTMYLNRQGKTMPVLEEKNMIIMGLHNMQNAMAAFLMVLSIHDKVGADADYEKIAGAIASFPGLAHRMEVLGLYKGRRFINDSKATTVGAVEMAIRSLKNPGVLILGGRTKGDDYSRLRASLNGNIKGLVLIGESKDYFFDIFKDLSPVKADDLDDALVRAMKLSDEGDVILLSPACASFDMFKNYEDRGDQFRNSYEKLTRGELPWT